MLDRLIALGIAAFSLFTIPLAMYQGFELLAATLAVGSYWFFNRFLG